MYVINVNGTKTFVWKFINLVVPGRIWVKYSKLFYRVKAVDCNLLSAFRSFEMCNGAKALIKSQMYFLFQSIFIEYRAQTLPSCLIEWLFRTRKGNVNLRKWPSSIFLQYIVTYREIPNVYALNSKDRNSKIYFILKV